MAEQTLDHMNVDTLLQEMDVPSRRTASSRPTCRDHGLATNSVRLGEHLKAFCPPNYPDMASAVERIVGIAHGLDEGLSQK